MEDSAVMAALLERAGRAVKEGGKGRKEVLEAAFAAFDAGRRERTQWLVQDSRRTGDLFEWRVDGVGRDAEKIRVELEKSCARVWEEDVEGMCREAVRDLEGRVGV